MKKVYPLILVCLIFLMGCGEENSSDESTNKPETEKPEEKKPAKVPDSGNWIDFLEAADLEEKNGLSKSAGIAKSIEDGVENLEVRHTPCAATFGPGMISVYSYQDAIKKIRIDWRVEGARSNMEYFFDDDQVQFIFIRNTEYANVFEAEKDYLEQETFEEPRFITEGRYYLDGTAISGITVKDGEKTLDGAVYRMAEVKSEDKETFAKNLQNDAENLLGFAKGEYDCKKLLANGFFP